jgi:hypothetical protein
MREANRASYPYLFDQLLRVLVEWKNGNKQPKFKLRLIFSKKFRSSSIFKKCRPSSIFKKIIR